MANLWFTSSYIWRPCWFSIFRGRWEYFTILFEILTDENVGIDTKNKSLDSLIRKIFVIDWFHLIGMLIRSITQNATDKKLFEILTVENVGIDTKTKSLEKLIRKIFVIEWFHLIRMLIRSIMQNAMDKKFSIRQFPSPEHPYIAFPQKNLAVLDISRFTTGVIGPQSRLLPDDFIEGTVDRLESLSSVMRQGAKLLAVSRVPDESSTTTLRDIPFLSLSETRARRWPVPFLGTSSTVNRYHMSSVSTVNAHALWNYL